VSARTLALPFFGRMTSMQVDTVVNALDRLLERTLTARKGRF
jgi:dTDP-4-amino-4,6-dideoxygalactose transaminase